ncbi:unnamed protein product [Psylliodes chrysocephalus]|uniref:Regulatory protein zeste n=1 Tax=Psylliodes chrysocephalus TaxID=3402493 RepID=A0A9P0CTT1_9CUCU|nr:unnamed protein product [Psylliodes chrysocephala]
MSFKIKEEHLEVLVDFMENHYDFATGRLSTNNAKDEYQQLWLNLTIRLNSLGLGERTRKKWQKTWTDYKCSLKRKVTEIKRAQEDTSGGPEMKKQLNNLEMRILSALGNNFYESCGIQERDLYYLIPSTSGVSSKIEIINEDDDICNMMPKRKKSVAVDNFYLVPAEKSKPLTKKMKSCDTCQNNDNLYKETIECLKNIETNISTNLKEINNTISSKFDELINAVLKSKGRLESEESP